MKRSGIIFAAGLLLITASPARAHLMNSGFGPFYDGLVHPFVTPIDLLVLIALALLAGLRGPACGRSVLFALPTAWLAGMAVGIVWTIPAVPMWTNAAVAVLLGLLVATDRPWPPMVVAALAVVIGIVYGAANGGELADREVRAAAAFGIACSLFVTVALLAAFVVSLKPDWTRLAVRVAGSWVAAIGLLLFGWTMR